MKQRAGKTLRSVLLAFLMLLILQPVSNAMIEYTPITLPNYIGDSALTWEIRLDGTLLIGGSGTAPIFNSPEDQPWADMRDDITAVYFTSMSDISIPNMQYWFTNCTNLKRAEIPYTARVIGIDAFADCPNLTSILFYYIDEDVFEIVPGAIDTTNPETSAYLDTTQELVYQKLHAYFVSEGSFATFADVYSFAILWNASTLWRDLEEADGFSLYETSRHTCSSCGAKVDFDRRISSDCKYDRICTSCGTAIYSNWYLHELPTEHRSYKNSNTYHESKCPKCNIWAVRPHQFNGQNICTECGYSKDTGTIVTWYTITWNSQGGSDIDPTKQTADSNLELPSQPTKDGYIFVGWFTDIDGGTQVDSSTTVTGDATYYAHWEDDNVIKGQCGDDLYWTFYELTGELRITGTGPMWDFESGINSCAGWYDQKDSITTVVIEEGATSVGNYAFYQHSAVPSVTLPSTLVSIGKDAFYSCSSLVSIDIPTGVTYIGEWAFKECVSLPRISIPSTVTEIGNYAFAECSGATNLTLSEGLKIIGTGAFQNCSNIKSTSLLPNGLETLGSSAFEGCLLLESVSIPTTITDWGSSSFEGCTSLTRVSLPEGITSIPTEAFKDCTSLSNISLPSTLTSIGTSAFMSCSSYKEVWVPKSVTSVSAGALAGLGENSYIYTYSPSIFTKNNHYTTPTILVDISDKTITWDAFGGTINGSISTTTVVAWNTYAISPGDATRAGYVFGGWYDAVAGGNSYTDVRISKNTTFYARWLDNTGTLTVDPNGSVWEGSSSPQSFTQDNGTTKTISNPTISNYTATFNANGGSCGTTSLTTNKTFTGWTQSNPFTVGSLSGTTFTFAVGTGTLTASWSGTYDITLPDASLAGYTFAGWYTDPSGGTYVGGAGSVITLSSNATYYAHWSNNSGTLTVDPNGGTWEGSTSQQSFTQDNGTTKTVNNPTIANYKVSFNANGGSCSTSELTTNRTFASWTQSNPFTAGSLSGTTFTFAVGTGTLTASWNGSYSITLPDASCAGYTFSGWFTAASGGTYIGGAGTVVTLSSNVTYYAQWVNNTGTLTVDPNGGSWNGTTSPQSFAQTAGTTKDIPNPTVPNYTATFDANGGSCGTGSLGTNRSFSGWVQSNPFTTGTLSGTTFTFAAGSGTLTANWAGSYAITLPDASRSGYIFDGWYDAASGGTKIGGAGTAVTLSANVTYYAQWVNNTGTLTVNPNGGTWEGSTSEQTFSQDNGTTKTINNPTIANYTASFDANGGSCGTSSLTTNRAFAGWTQSSPFNAGSLSGTTFTFSVGSGTLTASWSGSYQITLPSASLTGYTFSGWYTAASGGTKIGDAGATVTISSNVTYYAQWTANSYTISWDSLGGTSVADTSQIYGTNLVLPAEPTRTGYTFAGWFTDPTGGTQVGTSTVVSGSVTYYAHWTIHQSTLTVDPNGGTWGGSTAPQSFTQNYNTTKTIGDATTPNFTATFDANNGVCGTTSLTTNKTFAGWTLGSPFTAGSLSGTTFTFGATKDGAGTLMARWDGSHAITLPDASRTGYKFDGWYTAASGGTKIGDAGATVTLTATITYYAHWIPNRHTIKWDSQGGSTVTDTIQDYDSNLVLPTPPTRTGYTFLGWFTSPTGGAQVDASVIVLGDVTYYAHWRIDSYTVKWDSQGGSTVADTTQAYSSNLILPGEPSRTGYTFLGWFTAASGGIEVGPSTKVTGNVTFYAHWQVHSYTITWDSQGGSTIASTTQEYGSNLALPTPPTREGHTFLGWFTAISGGSQVDSSTTVTGNVTYYARWEITRYTITWDSQGGSSVTPTYQNHGSNLVIPSPPTRTGYTFLGWYTAASGGTLVDTAIVVTANATYYAHWQINTYTIRWDSQGGSAVADTKQDYSTNLALPTQPAREGYTFVGWFTAKTGGTQVGTSTKVTKDVTYYAQWTINRSTVTINPNGGAWNGSTSPQSFTQDFSSTLTVENATKPNFTVSFNANNGECSTSSLTTDVTFAGWVLSTPFTAGSLTGTTFTFGATKDGTGTLTASWSGSYQITLPTATRTGYTFAGWYTAPSGGSKIGDAGAKVTLSAAVTYYAQWTPIKYTITWNAAGGTPVSQTTTQDFGADLVFPTQPSRPGYTFLGWFSVAGSAAQENGRDAFGPAGDTSAQIFAGTAYKTPDNTTYYARWRNDNLCEIVTQPTDSITTYPAAPTLTGSAQGLSGLSTITYQWQMSYDNGVWTDISGATGSSYTIPAGTTAGTYFYRFVATSEFNGLIKTATSESVKVEIRKADDEMYVTSPDGSLITDDSQIIFALGDPAMDIGKVTCFTNTTITAETSDPSRVHVKLASNGTLTLTPQNVSYDIPVLITIKSEGDENYNPATLIIRAYVSDGPYVTATYTPDTMTNQNVSVVIRVVDVMQYLDNTHRVSSVVVADPSKTLTQVAGPSISYGDTNSDGLVNLVDAQYVTNYLSGAITEKVIDLAAADVDGNGQVTAHDADLILQKVEGDLANFPISYAVYYKCTFNANGTDVVSAADTWGSTREHILEVTWIDRVPPVLEVEPVRGNPDNGKIVTYADVTDDQSPFGTVQICWDYDPDSNNNVWATSYLADLVPGTTILVAAKDQAGNITVVEHYIKWNEEMELITSGSLDIDGYKLSRYAYMDADGNLLTYSSHPITGEDCIPVDISIEPALNGYLTGYAQLNTGAKYPLYWGLSTSSTTTGTATFYITASSLTTSQRNAVITVYVTEYQDAAMTKKAFSDSMSATIMVDITPPVSNISFDPVTGLVSITTRDALVGLDTVQYAVENAAGVISTYKDYPGTFQLADDIKYVHVKAKDKLENESMTSSVELCINRGEEEDPGDNEELIEAGAKVFRMSEFYCYIIGAN